MHGCHNTTPARKKPWYQSSLVVVCFVAVSTFASGPRGAVAARNLQQQVSCVCDGPQCLQRCCFDPATDYCGGDPPPGSPYWSDLERWHMGCSSFPAKPSNVNDHLGWCDDAAFEEFARSKTGSAMWKAEGPGVDDWWVFHGCDGAGLMTDCKGGVMYLEHYMDANKPVAYDPETDSYTLTWQLNPASRDPPDSNFNDVWSVPCEASNNGPQAIQACWKRHLRSLHVHPGTGSMANLDSGMWSPAEWKEAGKPWWSTMIPAGADPVNPTSTQLQPAAWYIDQFLGGPGGKAATGFVISYPWVCNKESTATQYTGWPDNTMSKWEFIQRAWSGSGSWGGGQPAPFSPNQGFINCYYDNEPWNGNHWDTGAPPLWQAFMFWVDAARDDHVWGYMVAEKGPAGGGDVVVRSQAQFAADVAVPSAYGPFKLNLVKQFP